MQTTNVQKNDNNGTHATAGADLVLPNAAESLPQAELRLPPSHLATPDAEIAWFPPALRSRLDGSLREELEKFEAQIPSLAPRIRLMWWNYISRASAAAQEMEDAEKIARVQLVTLEATAAQEQARIDAEVGERLLKCADLDTKHGEAREEFVEAIGAAKLPVDLEDSIRAKSIEDALDKAAPDLEELAGEHGVIPVPVPQKKTVGHVLSTFFFGAVAPVFCGFMVALCVGTVTGLVSLARLKNGDDLPLLGLMTVLGGAVVCSIGGMVVNTVRTLAYHREDRRPVGQGDQPLPRLGGGGIPYTQLALAFVLLVGEVTVEALGLRIMHEQMLITEQRFTGHAGTVLPFACYMLVGTLISAAFILYKGTAAWREAVEAQREAWLFWLRRSWLLARREEAVIQKAFGAAYAVETIGQEMARHNARLEALRARSAAVWDGVRLDPATQARLDYATGQAVGEAIRLHDMIENLTEMAEAETGQAEAGSSRFHFGRKRN